MCWTNNIAYFNYQREAYSQPSSLYTSIIKLTVLRKKKKYRKTENFQSVVIK